MRAAAAAVGAVALTQRRPLTLQQGRYSYVGAQPSLEVVAKEGHVTVLDHHKGTRVVQARAPRRTHAAGRAPVAHARPPHPAGGC